MDSAPSPSTLPQREPPRGPWGFWATAGWGTIAFTANDVAHGVGMLAFYPVVLRWVSGAGEPAHVDQALEQAGMFGRFVGLFVMLLVLRWAIRRRNGPGFAQYLGLRRFPPWQLGLLLPAYAAVKIGGH